MRQSVLLVLVAAIAVLPHGVARATDVPAVDFTASTWDLIPRPDTLGFEFTAVESVEVTMLGLYHPAAMTGVRDVGLWTNAGAELAHTTVGELGRKDQWLWQAITPVTLEAGKNYIVGGYVYYNPVYGDPNPPGWTVDPRVEFVHPRSSNSSSFSFPDVISSGTYYGNFGGNLKLKGPEPVPEPALIQLPLLLAMGAICVWRRRTR